ncbi:ABC transporter substrate-binding protein [Streptomyces sp. NPDC059378]|uniref:ABC transporter substrate-binding protein n=1 Tax=Streptomyces sp. NPDC059378 TaxID=3346815 RepID=UPI0036BDDA18
MRSVRGRILATLLVLAAVAAGGWQLLPAKSGKDGTITVGTTDNVTSLDPAGAYDAGSWALYSNVFQSLLTFEPGGGDPVPDAAESCSFPDGGLHTYQCRLRKDVTFPSGRVMTAEDVKFSFDRIKKINSPVGPASLFSTLASVDAQGSTVTFHLSASDATFPFKLATGAGSIVDSTRYPGDALRTRSGVDGSGPYTLTSYTKGRTAVLAPNERYRGALGIGQPVELRYYKNAGALENAWNSHRVQVAGRQLPPRFLAGLSASDPDRRVFETAGSETRNLYFDTRAGAPLHDPRVRRALAWLVDRDRLAATVYADTVEPLYSLIPAGITGHSTPFFDAYPGPDPARAGQLLAEAGVSAPVRLTYGYALGSGAAAEEAAELKRQLEAGGLFQVMVRGYEWTDFQKRWAAGRLDAYAVGWVADYPDPDTFAAPLVGTGSTMKTGYRNSRVDELILATRQTAERNRVGDDFRALQADVAADVPLIPLWQRKEYVVSTEDVGGGQYLSDGNGMFRLWRLTWI